MYKIAICTPSLGRPHYAFVNSLNALVKPRDSGPLRGETHPINLSDFPVDQARTHLTAHALATIPDLTHILWIDDDMVFPPDALQRLLAHDKDIVGGLCHNRRAPSYQPIAARKYDPALGMPQDAYGFVYDLPRSGLVEVDATGGAFLLVRAQVFREIEQRCGPRSWWEPAGEASEDFSFCARAKQCGYQIWIDAGLDIGHIGNVTITRGVAEKLRESKVSAWIPLNHGSSVGGPRVSVIIPTYSQKPAYLKAAVLSALNQTIPTEVIVVDDGTTSYDLRCEGVMDATLKQHVVWISKRARLIRHTENRGISAALNTGIAHMETDYFCWLSSDDLFAPDKVEKQLNAMLAVGAKASFHDYNVIDNTPESFGKYVQGPTWTSIEQQMRDLRSVCCINGSTVMVHRSVFAENGPWFDPDLRFGQDWEMWLRIGQHHLWHRIPEPLGVRREGENLTAQIQASPTDDARRKRRDEEDRIIRKRYAEKVYAVASVLGKHDSPPRIFRNLGAARAFASTSPSFKLEEFEVE